MCHQRIRSPFDEQLSHLPFLTVANATAVNGFFMPLVWWLCGNVRLPLRPKEELLGHKLCTWSVLTAPANLPLQRAWPADTPKSPAGGDVSRHHLAKTPVLVRRAQFSKVKYASQICFYKYGMHTCQECIQLMD